MALRERKKKRKREREKDKKETGGDRKQLAEEE